MYNPVQAKSPFRLFGEYRAQVTQVDLDNNKYGAVRVFIPDLMVDGIEPNYGKENYGIYAYPGNNSIGGYNPDNPSANYQASVSVPLKGSWVRVRFEEGDASKCFYTGAWNFKHSELPPENQNVDEPHKVHTIVKTGEGRSLIVCDSGDQARVELTGKRRNLSGSAGGGGGVYDVVGNMNTILIDERDGKNKILIASHLGDYIHLDIDQRMIQLYAKNDIRIQTEGQLHLIAAKGIELSSNDGGGDIKMTTGDGNFHISSNSTYLSQKGEYHVLSEGNNFIDGSFTFIQQHRAKQAIESFPTTPQGARAT